MNALKSAFKLSKNEGNNNNVHSLYEEVKSWDQARAKLLQNYLKVVQIAMDSLDHKVGQVERYIEGLDKLMSARIEEITTYCKNGVNDSQFFLVPNSLNSLKPCHQLLKHLLMEQSQRQQNLASKGSILTIILEKLKKLKAAECKQNEDESERQGNAIREMKSNIRYLIDCELPDVNEEVVAACMEVSSAFMEEKRFYLAVQQFVRIADRQVEKHRDIGRQLLSLVKTFSERQKEIRVKLRQILIQWVNQDLQDKIFKQQLSKSPTDHLINDYYDLEYLISEHSELWNNGSLQEYLQNFEVLPFREHDSLIAYSRQVFYNGKTEAKVILTYQKEAYLFRMAAMEPDFSFLLSKNIRIRQREPLLLRVTQIHKTLLLREDKDFEFTLEFNLQADMMMFQQKAEQLGCQLEAR